MGKTKKYVWLKDSAKALRAKVSRQEVFSNIK
jgi:hypothetical protein